MKDKDNIPNNREGGMTEILIKLTEDEFDDRYPLRTNHLNANASWTYGDGPGCLFETFGEEFAFVKQQDPRTVWTLVDGCENDDQYLISGLHFVNRIGYLVSTNPVAKGVAIEVHLPISHDEDDESASTEQEE